MKRDLYKYLLQWKSDPARQPLLIQGARQVGKTHLLKAFGNQEYKRCCYINFEETPTIKDFFEKDLKPHRIVRDLEIYLNEKFDPKDTLIIFDEVQECPNALTSLKYFCESAPEYSIAAAGSLLGVKMSSTKGFPVGKVHFCNLFPMSFLEFLDAIGKSQLRGLLEETKTFKPFQEPHHQQLIEFLKLYFYVGGMPKPLLRYIETQDLNAVRETQEDILKAYVHDFAKHAPASIVMKITQIWESIPIHLGKENKKFIFSAIRKSARARDYEEALQWLLDAELIHKTHLVTTPKIPLKSYGDTQAFKVYLLDVGLLGAMCKLPARVLVEGDKMFVEFKGSFTENYVAQSLQTTHESPLYYWASGGDAEVDFLLEKEGHLFPLEVKSGTSTKKKSLLVYQKKYSPSVLSRGSLMNLKKDGILCNYPLYFMDRFPMKSD